MTWRRWMWLERRKVRVRAFVWRHVQHPPLPVAEVSYDPAVGTSIRYAGQCHGFIGGIDAWSDDGTFTVQCAPHQREAQSA